MPFKTPEKFGGNSKKNAPGKGAFFCHFRDFNLSDLDHSFRLYFSLFFFWKSDL